MSYLNKRQKEFRRQIEELKKDDKALNTMYNNDSFYNNKAYENKENYKRKSNVPKIFYYAFVLILLLPFLLSAKNLFLNKINSQLKFNNDAAGKALINSINLHQNEQNIVVDYLNNFQKVITLENTIKNDIINSNNISQSNISKITERKKTILKDIISFENYAPDEIVKPLHDINIRQLYNYQQLYLHAEILLNDINNNSVISSYNTIIIDINNTRLEFQKELINIFDKINMNYTILDNGTITYSYSPY